MAITDAMTGRGFLTNDRGLTITEAGLAWLTDLGIDLASRKGSRPMIRPCLDWTERRIHLAGVVGAALCDWALRWHLVERIGSGRALKVTPDGQRAFGESFGIDMVPARAGHAGEHNVSELAEPGPRSLSNGLVLLRIAHIA